MKAVNECAIHISNETILMPSSEWTVTDRALLCGCTRQWPPNWIATRRMTFVCEDEILCQTISIGQSFDIGACNRGFAFSFFFFSLIFCHFVANTRQYQSYFTLSHKIPFKIISPIVCVKREKKRKKGHTTNCKHIAPKCPKINMNYVDSLNTFCVK